MALEFAKNYVRNAEKAAKKEKEAKRAAEQKEEKSVKKEADETTTEDNEAHMALLGDLSKIDVIA